MQLDKVNTGRAPAETEFEKNLEKTFQKLTEQLSLILTKGLIFQDNFDCNIQTVTLSAVVGTELEITHNLRKIPTGYMVVSKDKTGDIYNGSSAWTATTLYLKSSVSSPTITVLVF